MKKTFKGYSALIALLIALLVVTAMPAMAFAADDSIDGKEVKFSDGSYFDKDGKLVIPGSAVHHDVGMYREQVNLPTCDADGWIDYVCHTCEPTKGEDGETILVIHRVKAAATGHRWASESSNWNALVKEQASCTKNGIALDYCLNDCGSTREVPALTVVALGHDFYQGAPFEIKNNKYVVFDLADYYKNEAKYNKDYRFFVTKDPNCSEDGSAYFVCSRCDEQVKFAIEKTTGKNHVWSDWKVMAEATCKNGGKEWRRCTKCNIGREERLTPALAAEWKYKDIKVGADCFSATGTKYCANCDGTVPGHEPIENVALENYESHDLKEDVAYLYDGPAVPERGIKTIQERNISLIKDAKGKVTGYNVLNCNAGYTLVYACSKCGTNATKHNESSHAWIVKNNSAPGHEWSAWEKNAEGTYTKDGKEFEPWYRKCSRCNTTETWLFDKGVDPNNMNAQDTLIESTYELGSVNIKDGAGTVKVTQTSGNKLDKLYARVTWVYELSDGSTFAYAAMADVKDGTIKVGGAMTPNGATLVETQVALTDDAEANLKGEFHQIDGVKA